MFTICQHFTIFLGESKYLPKKIPLHCLVQGYMYINLRSRAENTIISKDGEFQAYFTTAFKVETFGS